MTDEQLEAVLIACAWVALVIVLTAVVKMWA